MTRELDPGLLPFPEGRSRGARATDPPAQPPPPDAEAGSLEEEATRFERGCEQLIRGGRLSSIIRRLTDATLTNPPDRHLVIPPLPRKVDEVPGIVAQWRRVLRAVSNELRSQGRLVQGELSTRRQSASRRLHTLSTQALAALDARDDAERAAAQQAAAEACAIDEQRRQAALEQSDQALLSARTSVLESLEALERSLAGSWGTLPWTDLRWRDFASTRTFGDGLLRVGSVTLELPGNPRLEVPALLPVTDHGNLLFLADEQGSERATALLIQTSLRAILDTPPEHTRIHLFDPEGAGENLATFQMFRREINAHLCREPREIEAAIEEITAEVQRVSQLRHESGASTFRDYNEQVLQKEPRRFVIIAGFPNRFTDKAALDLTRLARLAPLGGAHLLGTVKTHLEIPHGFQLEQLTREAHVVDLTARPPRWNLPYLDAGEVRTDPPPGQELIRSIVRTCNDDYKEHSEVKVPYPSPETNEIWTANAAHGIEVPIGVIGATERQHLVLGRDILVSLLVIGTTRIGKSNLLHVIILGIALRYAPSEVELYLLDFREGVEFADYAKSQLPHARVIAMQSEPELGLAVLQEIQRRIEDRGNRFRAVGASTLEEYRQKRPDDAMPRVLLVVDEFQKLFESADAVSIDIQTRLNDLVRRGGGSGVHVLLASQNLSGSNQVSRGTIAEMAVRIALKCSDADSRMALSERNDAASKLVRRGDAIFNDSHGQPEANRRFRVFHLPREEREALLDRITAKAREARYEPSEPPIYFRGDEVVKLDSCNALEEVIQHDSWGTEWRQHGFRIWLGKSVGIRPATNIRLEPLPGAHLVCLGTDEEALSGLLAGSLLAAAAQIAPGNAVFHLLSFPRPGATTTPVVDLLAEEIPHQVEHYGPRQPIGEAECLAGLYETLSSRRHDRGPRDRLEILLVTGLHRSTELRETDRYQPSESQKQLIELLRDGPAHGIHVLVWCDSLASFHRTASRDALGSFGFCLAGRMEVHVSNHLLGSSAASKLRNGQALLWRSTEPNAHEKLLPYNPPAPEWFLEQAQAIARRGGTR